MIEIQCGNGCSPNRCVTNDTITIPMEMGIPVVDTGMKQRHLVTSLRVNTFSAVGLVQIAAWTRPGKILDLRMSATSLGHDMLDVECGSLERLVHTAIFTTTGSSLLNMQGDVAPGHHGGVRPSKWRAVARTSASVSLSSTSASSSARSVSVK